MTTASCLTGLFNVVIWNYPAYLKTRIFVFEHLGKQAGGYRHCITYCIHISRSERVIDRCSTPQILVSDPTRSTHLTAYSITANLIATHLVTACLKTMCLIKSPASRGFVLFGFVSHPAVEQKNCAAAANFDNRFIIQEVVWKHEFFV